MRGAPTDLFGMTDDQRAFAERVIADAKSLDDSMVLLVGSLAAGYADSWSDIDLWVVGDKRSLSEEQRAEYDETRQVFVDRGDLKAHYSFYDLADIEACLARWPEELTWLLRTSRALYDPKGLAERLLARFGGFPADVLQRKLRWWYLKHRELLGRIGVIGRGMSAVGVMAAGACAEAMLKACCLADGLPFPYLKWLRRTAGETCLGESVCPVVDEALAAIADVPSFAGGLGYKELPTVVSLGRASGIMKAELPKLGWHGDWVENPGQHVWVLFNDTRP